MAVGVLMPKEGITVESCIIGEWKKKVGDPVNMGEVLFSYETDKAEFECESTAEGTLLELFYQNGDEVPCLANVCAIGNPGEDVSALRPATDAANAPTAPTQEASPAAFAAPAAQEAAALIQKNGAVSPRARSLATRAGVDAACAEATGPNGRVIERDVRRLMEQGAPVQAEAAAPVAATPVQVEAEYEDVKFNMVRKTTAKAMMHSLTTTAQLTEQFSFDATQIQKYRAMLKAQAGDAAKISLNDMVMFAVSRTLLTAPDLNANMIDDQTVRRFKHVGLGFACDTPRGLLVPTIQNADQMTLLEISQAIKTLAAEAREGSINPDRLTGATFTVSNLGSFGCEAFTPVINPPQTGILGVCNIQTRIKSVVNGTIETYPAMSLSLTFDHRVVDGAPAARFMAQLCETLENFFVLLAQ